MLTLDTSSSRFESLFTRIREGVILRWMLRGLIVAAVVTLALDYQDLREREAGGVPGSTGIDPVPMTRPTPGDQLRPYLPQTRPLGPGRETPDLPGYSGPADGTALSARMSFHVDDRGNLTAIGRMEAGTAEEFSAFLATLTSDIKTVYLHSSGGSVRDAIIMALTIREAGMNTTVSANAYCASACPLLFAGGNARTAQANAWIGVHQVYAEVGAAGGHRQGMADAQEISALCQQHLADMGVAPDLWINAMATPADQLYLLTPEELESFGLVT
jgi:ATP-dependent protease ClpP protease subunit